MKQIIICLSLLMSLVCYSEFNDEISKMFARKDRRKILESELWCQSNELFTRFVNGLRFAYDNNMYYGIDPDLKVIVCLDKRENQLYWAKATPEIIAKFAAYHKITYLEYKIDKAQVFSIMDEYRAIDDFEDEPQPKIAGNAPSKMTFDEKFIDMTNRIAKISRNTDKTIKLARPKNREIIESLKSVVWRELDEFKKEYHKEFIMPTFIR